MNFRKGFKIFLLLMFAVTVRGQHSIGANVGTFGDKFVSDGKYLTPRDITLNTNVYYRYIFGDNEKFSTTVNVGYDYAMMDSYWYSDRSSFYEYQISKSNAFLLSFWFGYNLYKSGNHSLSTYIGPLMRTKSFGSRVSKKHNEDPEISTFPFELQLGYFGGSVVLEYNLGIGHSVLNGEYPFELSLLVPISYIQSKDSYFKFFRITPLIGIQWNFGSGSYF